MTEFSLLQKATEHHYNSHPFDFLTKKDEEQIAALQPLPFINFVEKFLKYGDRVADIGCGGGRASLYLNRFGLSTYAFDLSIQSLYLTRNRCKSGYYTCGTNLSLPFRNQAFDAVVSDGVIHHTPDAIQSLKENIRVLKKQGVIYLAVYKKEGYYYYIYTYFGKPIRWITKNKLGSFLVTYSLGFLYHLVHKIRKKCLTTWQGSKNFFYDYLITPRATFYSKQQMEYLGQLHGLRQLAYDSIGNVHVFVFRKE